MLMKNYKNIAIVDDEKDILDMLSYNLKNQGYLVSSYSTGSELLSSMHDSLDLIILDVMMPHLDGIQTCKKLKQNHETKDIPVIFLTARDDEFDEVLGLELGAVDYISKPIKIKKIIARIRVALRNSKITKRSSGLEVDAKSRKVLIDKQPINLTKIEFDLLNKLYSNNNHVYSRNELISHLHNDNVVITDRAIDVHIRNIRKKIGKYSVNIRTCHGVGYSYLDEEII